MMSSRRRRSPNGTDSKVSLNKALWGLAEQMVTGDGQRAVSEPAVLTA
jgi:hypothetical protein